MKQEEREDVEWRYTKEFMDLEKLPLPPALRALPKHLRVYMRHDFPPSATELGRPAAVQRKQANAERTAYIDGYGDYNIWYGKGATYTADGRKEKIPADGHCQPFMESGYTQADLEHDVHAERELQAICLYFARGICCRGVNCKFYHRVPTLYDNEKLILTRDVFGRERFAAHKEDMTGVGSFNSESVAIFVGDYNRADDLNWLEQQLLNKFCVYGALKAIKVVPNRNFSFITYSYRAAAEFAIIAMNGWKLTDSDKTEILVVRWASPKEIARHCR